MRDKAAEKITSMLMDELTRLRKEQGLSHDKISEMTGLHRSTISLIESKKRNPTILTCIKVSKALGVDLSSLLRKLGS